MASIDVPAAGLTVPAVSEYCHAAALAGWALAVIVTPDSSGIVAFWGVTVMPVTLPPAAGWASSRWISPEAIARQTARLPAVRCSESTCSTPMGAPPAASGAATTGGGDWPARAAPGRVLVLHSQSDATGARPLRQGADGRQEGHYGFVVLNVNVSVLAYVPVRSGSVARCAARTRPPRVVAHRRAQASSASGIALTGERPAVRLDLSGCAQRSTGR